MSLKCLIDYQPVWEKEKKKMSYVHKNRLTLQNCTLIFEATSSVEISSLNLFFSFVLFLIMLESSKDLRKSC